tara:strand:+ start:462 stop:695 length:234 start_codon:yes stop_codon:yes gene_type:complete
LVLQKKTKRKTTREVKQNQMTDKVDCAIYIWDNELQRKKRIRLQTLLNRVNHTLRNENQTYFALSTERDQFAKECRT